jgi:DNA-binding protein HU-beta
METSKRFILTPAIVFAVLLGSIAAPVSAAPTHDQETASDITAVTLDVMKSQVDSLEDPGLYEFYQDGNDMVVRKKPGRTTYKGPIKPIRLELPLLEEKITSESGLSKADAKRALEGFADSQVKALKKADEVTLVGVGSFYQEYCSKSQRSREKAKKTACRSSLSDYLDADSDGDGIGDTVRKGGNPQTGKEIKIPAKNVVRGSGATGEITVGEEVSINLPNGRTIVREVGKKK